MFNISVNFKDTKKEHNILESLKDLHSLLSEIEDGFLMISMFIETPGTYGIPYVLYTLLFNLYQYL